MPRMWSATPVFDTAPPVAMVENADFLAQSFGRLDAEVRHEVVPHELAHLAPEHTEIAGAKAAAPELDGSQARVIDAPRAVAIHRQQVIGRQRQRIEVRYQLPRRGRDDFARIGVTQICNLLYRRFAIG